MERCFFTGIPLWSDPYWILPCTSVLKCWKLHNKIFHVFYLKYFVMIFLRACPTNWHFWSSLLIFSDPRNKLQPACGSKGEIASLPSIPAVLYFWKDQTQPCRRRTVIAETASGMSLAQCVSNHHTLNPLGLWHKTWSHVLCLQEPSPCWAAVILQFLPQSVASVWQNQFSAQSCIVPSALEYQESRTRFLGPTLLGLCLQWEFFV